MCSVIVVHQGTRAFLGASYDFYYGHGMLVTNKRGLFKTALGECPPYHQWAARYGSLTFNQFGRELPTCGLNEQGLAVHLLQLEGGQLPAVQPERPRLNELQWIQYQLDSHATVRDVIDHVTDIQIEKVFIDLHFAVCDASGHVGFIEFVDGRPVITEHRAGGVALTNHSYRAGVDHVRKLKAKTGVAVPRDNSSLSRFARLTALATGYDEQGDPIEYLFHALGAVSRKPTLLSWVNWLFRRQPPAISFWNTVFDPHGRQVHYRTYGNDAIRKVTLERLDFSTNTPVLVTDVQSGSVGDVTSGLRVYSRNDNAAIIQKSYQPLGNQIPLEHQQQLVTYPETFSVLR